MIVCIYMKRTFIIGVVTLAVAIAIIWQFAPNISQLRSIGSGGSASVIPLDQSYDVNVLVLKYFPLTPDKQSIDTSVTGALPITNYDRLKEHVDKMTVALENALERSSTYLGYKDPSAQPSLRYNIIETKVFESAFPIRSGTTNRPDYAKVLNDNDICNYIDGLPADKKVQEVWIWAYQGSRPDGQAFLGISESYTGGSGGSKLINYNNSLPLCGSLYKVYTYNYERGTAEALESWGHQMEYEMDTVDAEMFGRFNGFKYPAVDGITGRCGDVHNTPNSRFEYDRNHTVPNNSDCLDWQPEGLGSLSPIDCRTWGCDDIDSYTNNAYLNYQIWHWQNLPGRNNTKTFRGVNLRNWWDVHGDTELILWQPQKLLVAVPQEPNTCVRRAPLLKNYRIFSHWGAFPGSQVTFFVDFKNEDSVRCSSSTFDIEVALPNGWSRTGATSYTLSAGETRALSFSVNIPDSTPASTNTIPVSISRKFLNEVTNVAATKIVVQAPLARPNLTGSLTAQPTNPRVNEPITFTGKMKNTGSAMSEHGAVMRFCLDPQDPMLCITELARSGQILSESFNPLAPQQEVSRSFSRSFSSAGNHVLYVCVDARLDVQESNEGDNCTAYTFSVGSTALAETAPSIITQPASKSVPSGQRATFSVVARGTTPLSYQWQKDGVNIPGATLASYTTPITTVSNTGTQYRAIITNRMGSVTSDGATLTVTNVVKAAPDLTPTNVRFCLRDTCATPVANRAQTIYADVQNIGNLSTANLSAKVSMKVLNLTKNTTVYGTSYSYASISANSPKLSPSWSGVFVPDSTSTYRIEVTTSVTSDSNTSNNTAVLNFSLATNTPDPEPTEPPIVTGDWTWVANANTTYDGKFAFKTIATIPTNFTKAVIAGWAANNNDTLTGTGTNYAINFESTPCQITDSPNIWEIRADLIKECFVLTDLSKDFVISATNSKIYPNCTIKYTASTHQVQMADSINYSKDCGFAVWGK